MSDFDLDLIELMTAIIGSITAVAAVVVAVIQYKSVRLELRTRQGDQDVQEPSTHPKQTADGDARQ